MATADVSYVPGALTAVAGDQCWALVEVSPDSPAVGRIWQQLGQGVAADTLLAALIANGMGGTPGFTLLMAGPGGQHRLFCRGTVGATVVTRPAGGNAPQGQGPAAAERIDGAGLLTWREQVVGDAERIFLGEPPADTAMRLPATSGVLLAGCVVVDLASLAARDTAYYPRENPPAPEPPDKTADFYPDTITMQHPGSLAELGAAGSSVGGGYLPDDRRPMTAPAPTKPFAGPPAGAAGPPGGASAPSEYPGAGAPQAQYQPPEYPPAGYPPADYPPADYRQADYPPGQYQQAEYQPPEYQPGPYPAAPPAPPAAPSRPPAPDDAGPDGSRAPVTAPVPTSIPLPAPPPARPGVGQPTNGVAPGPAGGLTGVPQWLSNPSGPVPARAVPTAVTPPSAVPDGSPPTGMGPASSVPVGAVPVGTAPAGPAEPPYQPPVPQAEPPYQPPAPQAEPPYQPPAPQAEPAPNPNPNPEPAPYADPAPYTLPGPAESGAAVQASRPQEPAERTISPDRIGPVVPALLCPNGHVNPPGGGVCRRCGSPLPHDPVPVPRPVLGVLRLSLGDVIMLDRGVLMGRNPRTDFAGADGFGGSAGGERPHVVKLPTGDGDISRTHLRVTLDGWHVLVTDLNSTNGTLVTLPGRETLQLRPGEPLPIQPGTVVTLADGIDFRYEASE
jgi:hypothetical protein